MSSRSTSNVAVLLLIVACAASSSLSLPGCSQVEAEEPRDPGAIHLFSSEAVVADTAQDYLPLELRDALAADVTWVELEGVKVHDWGVDKEADIAEGSLAIRLEVPYPILGKRRVVDWDAAHDPQAGRYLDDAEGLVLGEREVAIGQNGLTIHLSAAQRKEHVQPPLFSFAVPTQGEFLRGKLLGVLPTLENVAHPRALVIDKESRRVAWAPGPARLSWRVQVPQASQLRFGYGLRGLALEVLKQGADMRFVPEKQRKRALDGGCSYRVDLRTERDAEGTILWESELFGEDSDAFRDGNIDLTPWAGQWVELSFITTPLGERPNTRALPFWAEPVLDDSIEDQRPDLVLIVLDTLRADGLHCYGNERPVSPFIDSLAASGVRYDDAMSAATWTLPSHVSMLTSLYPPQHGVLARERLSQSLETLGERLRDNGYQTLASTEGLYLTPRFGVEQGFDRFESGPWDARQTVDRALAQLKGVRGPMFHFLHTYQVHAPYDPPPTWRKKFVDEYEGTLGKAIQSGDWYRVDGGLSPADKRYITQMYDAEVAYVDAQIRRYCDALKARGRWDNTLVIVTSDHGESFEEHDVWGHGSSLFQEQLRVPLIVHQPGVYEGGLVAEHPVHTVDFAPTFLKGAGIEQPASWMGEALGLEAPATSRPLFSAFTTQPWGRPVSAYREGSMKAIQYAKGEGLEFDPHTQTLLFDLSCDPNEQTNLWHDHERDPWLERLDELWERFEAQAVNEEVQFEADFIKRLKEVGYTGD